MRAKQKPRAFLIHWNENELPTKRKLLRKHGFIVASEWENGGRAMRAMRSRQPDVIVIYLSQLPFHGIRTARALQHIPVTKVIPIIFVDGNELMVGKAKTHLPEATFTNENKLASALKHIHVFHTIHSLIRKESFLWQ